MILRLKNKSREFFNPAADVVVGLWCIPHSNSSLEGNICEVFGIPWFCKVWRGRNGWWWGVGCRWRIESAVWICTVFGGFRVWLRWWGMVDWGGLGIWSVRVEMIGCRPVEMWWWQGWDVRVGAGRLGENEWRMIWRSWVCTLNG